MTKTNVIIAMARNAVAADVAAALRANGVDVKRVLDGVGTITGAVEASKVDAIRKLPGVEEVDVSSEVVLPEPDAAVQ